MQEKKKPNKAIYLEEQVEVATYRMKQEAATWRVARENKRGNKHLWS